MTGPAQIRLHRRFRDRVVVADGAMGSELLVRLPRGSRLDLAPLEHPEMVLEVHLAYLEAGAEVLETASFGASRPRLERIGAGSEVAALNEAAVKLARQAREVSGADCLVAGAVAPLGGLLATDDPAQRQIVAAAFREQAAVLAGRGADLLVLESFTRREELELALEAVRAEVPLPVVAMMSFTGGGSAADLAERAETIGRLAGRDVLAAGVNCSPGPWGTLEVLERVPGDRQWRLAAMPSAGVLGRRNGRLVAPPATPSYLADFARRAAAAGAVLVGGCCGLGPDHIRAMAQAVRGVRPAGRRATAVAVAAGRREEAETRRPTSGLAETLAAGRFARVVQLDPPRGSNADRLVAAARTLAASGAVDAFDINANPLARLRMDSLWLAAEIQRETGVETIPHITPRDGSVMGIQAQLLGGWRAGLRNLLAITGDPSQAGDYPGVRDVYHVDVAELVRGVRQMAGGIDFAGNRIGQPPAYLVGVAVDPGAEDLDREIERLDRKVQAGAAFAMSQVFFSWEPWLRLLDRCGGSLPVPALVGVWPLSSLNLALRLHHEVPGISVPEDLLAALDRAGPGAARVGFERAARMLAEAPALAAGAYLIAPFRNPEEIAGLVGLAGPSVVASAATRRGVTPGGEAGGTGQIGRHGRERGSSARPTSGAPALGGDGY